MITQKQALVTKDAAAKKITVIREFDAPSADVWKAWTTSDLLDQWWAPKPWKAKTKSMDFREGGSWLYSMQGPEGPAAWACMEYKTIVANKQLNAIGLFCDENGNINHDFPSMNWKIEFQKSATGAKVVVEMTFTSEADMEKILQMGFQEGFTAALGNLDEMLAK